MIYILYVTSVPIPTIDRGSRFPSWITNFPTQHTYIPILHYAAFSSASIS